MSIQTFSFAPSEQAAIERILGRSVGELEIVNVSAKPAVSPAPTGSAREAAIHEFKASRIDVGDADPTGIDEIIDEAIHAARQRR